MSISETTQRVRLSQWTKQVRDCKSSGMSTRDWCRENGINEKVYYYRQRRVREELIKQKEPATELIPTKANKAVTFAKVNSSSLVKKSGEIKTAIDIGGDIKVLIYDDADEEIITTSLRAVMSLCSEI